MLLFLSGSASLYVATRPGSTKSPYNVVPRRTPADQPGLAPSPFATDNPALQDATPLPINFVVAETDSNCLKPVIPPAKPAVIPSEGGIDKTTGRHVMGDVQVLDVHSYRLAVSGLVDHPLSLSYDDLRCMPKVTETVTTTCYDFADTARWSGVLISDVLKKAGVQPSAKKVIQKAPDRIVSTVSIEMAMDPHNFLAYEMEGKPLPVLFGFPVRSIFIDVAGQYSIKWLTSLEVI